MDRHDLNENSAHLLSRVHQLENEREELRKDIEQLCMQNTGPAYVAVATRMHFQRTAALEQDIDNLRKTLASCMRDTTNLQEELSEAYQIKSQLADLHSAEVAKNMEAENQVKFFQKCVAAAFAERDQSIIEVFGNVLMVPEQAETAKEKQDIMTQKLNDLEKRAEELTLDFLEEKKKSVALQIDLEKQEKQYENFKKVINKFYEIRQHLTNGIEDISWEDKCECLLHDSEEMWSFNDYPTSRYITALEEEVETLRKSVDNLQSRQRMGLEIESHLKRKVGDLEKHKMQNLSAEKMGELSELLHQYSQFRTDIINLLDEGSSNLKLITGSVEEMIKKFEVDREQKSLYTDTGMLIHENERGYVHVNNDAPSDLITKVDIPVSQNIISDMSGDASEAEVLSQALHEKVATLLLLSQQEERNILESNVNVALQNKIEDLQIILLQVTNEKVKALMELAQIKQDYHLLQEKVIQEINQGNPLRGTGEKRIVQDKDGRLKNILKKTYLKKWIDPQDASGDEAGTDFSKEGTISEKVSHQSMDFARLKVENAALRESLESMRHLTFSIHRLRLSLLKVRESILSMGTVTSNTDTLKNIIYEAELVKTALGSSLPVSWSAETVKLSVERSDKAATEVKEDLSGEKVDCVSAAGREMVELLIFASQILLDEISKRD
ncbi:uncharacterized protein LOC141670883 isoform X1 [Apium graveolens]|uniref:uncharacterized protein LOC141670883 isoform X1 n=3 Tax=Apium graveolens TaxID=4045 RepID=UPI003D793917